MRKGKRIGIEETTHTYSKKREEEGRRRKRKKSVQVLRLKTVLGKCEVKYTYSTFILKIIVHKLACVSMSVDMRMSMIMTVNMSI